MMSDAVTRKPRDLRWCATLAVPLNGSTAERPSPVIPRVSSFLPMKPSSLVLLPIYRTCANIGESPEPCPSVAMPSYRITFRYGAPRALYEMLDIDAADLRAAMRAAADQVSEEVAASAELVEVRAQKDDDERAFTPG